MYEKYKYQYVNFSTLLHIMLFMKTKYKSIETLIRISILAPVLQDTCAFKRKTNGTVCAITTVDIQVYTYTDTYDKGERAHLSCAHDLLY